MRNATESITDVSAVTANADLLTVAEAARLLACSTRTLRRLVDSGAAPAPVRLGRRLVRWRADELRQWISAGCPAIARQGARR